ncbi:MAG: LamG domain-containing protein [Planctomycetales bacterium]|nr:LamG domain-containing protein [Planctomycetales bacterium]
MPALAQTNATFTVSLNSDDADQDASSGQMWVGDGYSWLDNYCGARFQNVTIPAGATITSATLELFSYGSGTASFSVTVKLQDADNPTTFTTSNYNLSSRPVTTAQSSWTTGSVSYSQGQAFTSPNFSSAVQEVVDRSGWSSGNSMVVILVPVSGGKGFWKRAGNSSYAPRLHVTYTTAAGAGTVLLVTSGSSPNSEESARKTTFEGWGYTVTTIEDNASQASFDAAVASSDVVYVPSTIQDWELLYKLRTASCGVVTETYGLDTEFGYATSDGYTESQSAIYITDNTHEVSTGLSVGAVTIFSSTQTRALNGNTLAAGMTTLGMNASQNMLTLGVIDAGGTLANTYNSNSTASGRRVRMPWGNITWSALNSNGLSIAQNALSWASGGASGGGGYELLMVTAGSTPTTEESNKKTQFETWGYTVTTIQDGDSQANFDTALGSADVVYVPQSASATDLAYKLRSAEIGVVQEGVNSWDDNMGWTTSTGQNTNTCTTMTVVDNTHPISQHFSTGSVTIFNSSTASYGSQVVPTVASGAEVLATNLCVNSGRANLLAMEVGSTLANTYNGNSAARGRRVRLPYGGGSTFSWSNLSSGGLTMVQKALAWAAEPTLMLHYTFDEGTGTTITDSSRSEADAEFNTGTPTWTTGVRGGALEFNGSNDADTDSSFDPPATGTVAFWFRFNATPAGSQRLLGSGGDWEVRVDASGVLYADLSGDGVGGGFQTPSGSASAGRWRHFAAVYNSDDDTFTLYLDGEQVASGSMTLTDQTANTLSLGTRTGSTERFNGALDDFRVYNYELTQAEVAELYGLVGHWRLDETSGTTATDSSNIGHDATYWSGAAPGAAGPYPGAGAYAADLDGVDDNIGASSIDAYDNIEEYVSIAAWVYFDTAIADQTSQQSIVSRDDWSTKKGFILLADQPYGDRLLFRVYDGTTYGDAVWDNPGIGAGEWHHVVGTYDGATVKLYVDGELKGSTAFTSPIEPNAGDSVGMGYNLDGRLHDVRLYNRAITHAEIAEIYGLVAHWKLDETSGTTAYDSSGMGNDAALTGAQGWTTEGQVDGGFAFDYTDGEEYLEAPSNTTLDDLQENDYAITTWFKPNSVPAGVNAEYNASYGLVSKNGYHLGLCFGNGQNFYNEHWLETGPSWAGAGTWSDTYPTGAFYHVAAVVNRTDGEIKLYLNGELKETVTFTAGETSWDYGSNLWRIGVSYPGFGDWGHPCDGVIDDARLYNRALGDDEVLKLYQAGQPQGLRILQWVEAR